jgi:release factor glutamine methyltransferase
MKMIIREALLWGQKILQAQDKYLNPQIDSEQILEFILKINKTKLYLNLEEPLSHWHKLRYQRLIKKRAKLYPLAYLLGTAAFYNLTLKIKTGVFVPRPETELLVEELLKILKSQKHAVTISEIGIGSGAIALALLHNAPEKIEKYYANDLSLKARQIAKTNARQYQLDTKLKIIAGKNLPPLQKYRAEILIANPPYVPYKKYQTSPTIQNEPWRAITDKNDGLDFFRQLLNDLTKFNYYPEIIALEFDEDTTTELLKVLKPLLKLYTHTIHKDWQGLDRFIVMKYKNK